MTKKRKRMFRKCLHRTQKKSPSLAYHTHTVGTEEVFSVKDYSRKARLGVLELNNIVLSVLWLRERKQQDKSCLESALSLGLKVLSSVWYLLLIKQHIVHCRYYFESLFIFLEN